MGTASLELCRELRKISGWDDVAQWWYDNTFPGQEPNWVVQPLDGAAKVGTVKFPAYDLGYLLRKLPLYIDKGHLGIASYLRLEPITDEKWATCYGYNKSYDSWADTPEDAACKLAIELFKQGILTKETK